MKKQFTKPVISLNMFMNEDIVTVSGNALSMKNKMEADGYSVKTFDWKAIEFVG